VLVNFTNKSIDSEKVQYFKNLFFSPNEFPAVDYMQTDENKKPYTSNSVTNYYSEVSGGLISFTGDVIGPYTLDHPIEWYANGCYGGASPPSWGLKKTNDAWGDIRTMGADALDKVIAANEVDLKKYDNKGRFHGYIDAFIVVHAGDGGEDHILNFLPGPEKDHTIWSCKWVLPGNDPREVKTKSAQTVKISPLLTVPETAKLGVCCHEVGHLVFGWPDLYDIGSTSRHGIGPWCLMAEGCWGGNPNDSAHNVPGGSVPCHPSAWCKNNAGWVKAIQPTSSGSISLSANVIKAGTTATLGGVEKLWTNGDAASKEYFLLENRQKAGFDKYLPGTGLLGKL
jgi:immune inhibitor A